MRKKILVVDDEVKLLKFLAGFLQREGFEVVTATSGQEALAEFKRCQPDLVILDVMMPDMDGFEVCRRLRMESDVPIIFLSARGETMDRIMGLTLGSDDYLSKPFDSAELLLRIKAVLRRRSGEKRDVIEGPGFRIDREARTVVVEGREVELTPKEFDFLWLLASNPNRVFTREQLIYHVWNTDYCGDTGVVTVLVKRLREKIEPDPARPRYVKTIRGVGYKFGGGKE